MALFTVHKEIVFPFRKFHPLKPPEVQNGRLSLSPPFLSLSVNRREKFLYFSKQVKKKTYHDESNVIVGFHT